MIKVGIVEDKQKIRDRIKQRLDTVDDIVVSMSASNGEQAMKKLGSMSDDECPELILMDIALPGMSGIETTILVKENYPDIHVVMQTVFEDEDKIFNSIQAGASGYLLKDIPLKQYVDSIRMVEEGGAPITPTIATKVLEYMRKSQQEEKQAASSKEMDFDLTNREMEILELIVEDLTDDMIADRLYISPHTVRTHIKNIYKKLHIHSRASAVRFAFENKLFT